MYYEIEISYIFKKLSSLQSTKLFLQENKHN